MPGAAFEGSLAAIFARCDAAVAVHLAKVKARSEALQSQDTSRLAFTLTEAIEQELRPAVDEALASYDAAINRPLTPNPRWEEAVRDKIGSEVDAAVAQALHLDLADHPWKPLLKQEAPQLRERLLALADAHFAKLGKSRKPRRRGSAGLGETLIRLGCLGAGLAIGAIVAHFATT